jgi:predicted nicotinamide N-methyase
MRNVLFGLPPSRSEVLVSGIRLRAEPSKFEHFYDFNATGAKIWPSTHVLVKYISEETTMRKHFCGSSCLELGSGLGLVGLSAAALGAACVTLTDRRIPKLVKPVLDGDDDLISALDGVQYSDEQLQALKSTVEANRHVIPNCNVTVEELSFGDHDAGAAVLSRRGPFDVILGSDITYFSGHLPRLMNTLQQVCSTKTIILLGHSKRRVGLDNEVFEALKEAGFSAIVKMEDGEQGVMIIECRQT